MRLSLTFYLIFTFVFIAKAQKSGITGIVTDAATGEPIIGAAVSASSGKAAATDLDGNYKLELDAGGGDGDEAGRAPALAAPGAGADHDLPGRPGAGPGNHRVDPAAERRGGPPTGDGGDREPPRGAGGIRPSSG